MRQSAIGMGISMFVAAFAMLGLGLILGWSDGAIGWGVIVAGCIAEAAWLLTTSGPGSSAR